uniref:Neurochondrin n=2 Tax=Clastoptera arizonana TaxID=38151 RepID=A0A1B6BYF0_9HEMI
MEREETNRSGSINNLENLQIDIDEIKGDVIGDTVYSERFVLRLLIKLNQYSEGKIWNEEFESDLCTLWDMTAASAVVLFLMQYNGLEIFINTVQCSTNFRLTEILIGIIGNMCCEKSVRNALAEHKESQDTLLSLLSNPDPQTLVQLMRIVEHLAWDIVKPQETMPDKHWFEKQLESGVISLHLGFILSSSTSEELLNGVLVVLNTFCSMNFNDKDFSQYFASSELISAMLECWKQIFSSCHYEIEFEFPNKQLEKSAHNWVSILLAFTGHEEGRSSLGKFGDHLNDILQLWIVIPKDNSEILLTSIVRLLEGIVAYSFSAMVFSKVLKAVYVIVSEKGPFLSKSILN